MSIKISRPLIYLMVISVISFIFILVFSFVVLIPEGKDYRKKAIELSKENIQYRKYKDYHSETADILDKLESKSRHVTTAFDTNFDPSRFKKNYSSYFRKLTLSRDINISKEENFSVYEVNTVSQISSPVSFYNFLEAVNKSDWIININFPINFKREDELIRSTFSMKVYKIAPDNNTSKSDDINTTK